MAEGRWIETCGCGRETHVRAAALVVTGGTRPCEFPHPHFGEIARVNAELGWCGCGTGDRVDEMMLAYLGQSGPVLHFGDDAGMLVAYMADALGWTEHGGSIGGAWLTEDGEQALANLRAHVAVSLRE